MHRIRVSGTGARVAADADHAHVERLGELRQRFLGLATGIESFEVRDVAALERQIGEADVLVISGLWRNDLLPRAKRLRFIQSIGAGTDQFSREALKQHGVRLASARGVNARAVAEHVMALMLAARAPASRGAR